MADALRAADWERSKGGDVWGPPPRPGVDEDPRLQKIEDDPRYFRDAQLGKAQLAALGKKGLAGRNTASFDPKSTLVRPGMRIIHGPCQSRFGRNLKPDDVVMVPEFHEVDGGSSVYDYDALRGELRESWPEGGNIDVSATLPLCNKIVMKLCKYFALSTEGTGIELIWYRKTGHEPKRFETRAFRESKGHNCRVTITIGAMCELAFKRKKTGETVYCPLPHGNLLFLGRDIIDKWQHGEASAAPSGGSIVISVSGKCTKMVEEEVLVDAAAAAEASKGPCRDFKFGRCNYGDRCRFSHGQEESTASSEQAQSSVCAWPKRPLLRVITVRSSEQYSRPISHDDVIVVPEFFCTHDDWSTYYKLLHEMRQSQASGDRKAEWMSWHEGAHLLSQNPTGSPTYQKVLDKLCKYFSVAEGNRGTRFNWYRDGSDWKPFHHDSAAFNAQRAKNQNCTIGISFGASRELALRHAKTGELLYFPQTNGMLFFFGRDANIVWQHGINALPEKEQDGKGRISIILWGWCNKAFEEEGSPPMLDDDSRQKGGPPGFDMRRTGGQEGAGSRPNNSGNVCRDFLRGGSCSYGDRCRFSHDSR